MMDFQTKEWVCKYMVNLIPDGVVSVLEPTPGEGNLVKALNKYDVTAPENFWDVTGIFDAVVMNPPFTPMKYGYEILYSVMEMSNIVIALMPWLTIINSEKRTKDIFEYGLRSVTHLPRSVFPGARVQTCILNMHKGFIGKTVFEYVEEI